MQRSIQRARKVWLLFSVVCLLVSSVAWADKDVSRESARIAPQWLGKGVIYEIFPRDFSAKGDLNGVTAQLDALQDLGVTVLWLMPIHPIGEKLRKGTYGSPYAIRDYYAINPDYGTVGDLKRLVTEAHKRNLKVLMDLVVNHTAWDSVMMAHPVFTRRTRMGKSCRPFPTGATWPVSITPIHNCAITSLR